MKRFTRTATVWLILLCVICQLIPAASASALDTSAEMLKIKSNIEKDAGLSSYVSAQGACSDGTYAYVAMPNGSATVLKYRLSSFRLVKKRGSLPLGHANDMTFNSRRNLIVVSNNAPDYDTVTLLDPDTLKVVGTVKLTLKIYSIAYCESEDCYYVGISGGYNFARLGPDFNVRKKFAGSASGYTRQGCDCDDKYVYFAQSGGSNLVVVYDHNGGLVGSFSLGSSYEVENIFHAGNNFYTTLHYYGNYIHRIGFSQSARISYTVRYDAGKGTGTMQNTRVHYGEMTPLRANTFTRDGYFFSGWYATRSMDKRILGYRRGSSTPEWLTESELDSYKLFRDKASVARTVKYGSVTMTATWVNERYDVRFASDNAEGEIAPFSVQYDESFTVPENTFVKPGFVFVGYYLERACDGKSYGYRRGSKTPEWLSLSELQDDYYFYGGESVGRLSYDGPVTFVATFRSAFGYDPSGSTVIEYIGTDVDVTIPDREGEVTAVAAGAFTDCSTMQTLTVPSSIDTIESHAIVDCPALETIRFRDTFPAHASGSALIDCGTVQVYLLLGDDEIPLGWYTDAMSVRIMKTIADKLTDKRSAHELQSPEG